MASYEHVDFLLGERKEVCISVYNQCREPFDITSATWVLKKGDEIEKQGNCEITHKSEIESILTALIQPMAKRAEYVLEFTYDIPPQILKKNIQVRVK